MWRFLSWVMVFLVVMIGFGDGAIAATSLKATSLKWGDVPIESTGYTKATKPRDWQFPRDFGAHPEYQTEWWYYTGNLATAVGRPFGYQLTFFRQAVRPDDLKGSKSDWRSRQIYSAHFTVSDIEANKFYQFERFSRGGAALAGADADPYAVWLGDWSASEGNSKNTKLIAKDGDIEINLDVNSLVLPVLQGDRGFSVKGSGFGNASNYYSLVQQGTSGVIKIKGEEYQVKGKTWKDHEFSTSALSVGTIGWDWFSMQFDNGTALMLYLLRREDGSLEPTSAGTFIGKDGKTMALDSGDWDVQVVDRWRSARSGASYPAKWQIKIPSLDMDLQATAMMADQELNTAAVNYWEGAVKFAGRQGASALNGAGYVELTGYAGRMDRILGGLAQ